MLAKRCIKRLGLAWPQLLATAVAYGHGCDHGYGHRWFVLDHDSKACAELLTNCCWNYVNAEMGEELNMMRMRSLKWSKLAPWGQWWGRPADDELACEGRR